MKNPSKYAEEFLQHGVLKSVSIIDTHAHMGTVYGTSLPQASAEEMVAAMDRRNVEMIWCSPHSALFDPNAENAEIESVMTKYPDRIKGFFAFNPNYADRFLPRIGTVLDDNGYIGFKFLPEYHKYALDGPGYSKALEFANANKLVVLSHTWGGSAYNSTAQVRIILNKYKDIIFIMGHSAPGECEQAIELARNYENAYLDLCDIHRHSGIIDKMVTGAGAEKVLFGTDIPWYDPNYCLGGILFSRITESDKYKIIRGNAAGILKRIQQSMESRWPKT